MQLEKKNLKCNYFVRVCVCVILKRNGEEVKMNVLLKFKNEKPVQSY